MSGHAGRAEKMRGNAAKASTGPAGPVWAALAIEAQLARIADALEADPHDPLHEAMGRRSALDQEPGR